MALINCPECGKEISDQAQSCINCGYVLHKETTIANDNGKKKMFSAHLLNIIAFCVPFLLAISSYIVDTLSQSEETNDGGLSISVGADVSSQGLFIAVLIGIAVFIIGLVLFFTKNIKTKKTLSYIYLIGSIVAISILFFTCAAGIVATCGLGIILFVPGILQIIAGTKFVSGVKDCEKMQ